MNLLDTYIRTLRMFLPKDQRDDITRELSEEIGAQAADRESELGRPLTTDEQASILQQYGHPLLTAARYRPQQHLIGPVVFPHYWLALRILLGLVALGHGIALVVQLSLGVPPADLGRAVQGMVQNLLAVTAWLTVIAALVDRWLQRSKVLERWDPRKLLPPAGHAGRVVAGALHDVGRFHRVMRPPMFSGEPRSVSAFVVAVVFSVWWLLALRFPYLMFGPWATGIEWGPAMDRLYPVLVLSQVTLLASQLMGLTTSPTARAARISRLVWMVAGVFFIYFVLVSDQQWVTWRGEAEDRARATVLFTLAGRPINLVTFVNAMVGGPFVVIAVLSLLDILRRAFRWIRPPSARTPALNL